MAVRDHDFVDTVIVGNGPAALILSYILHGRVPYYTGGHWDALIDRKLATHLELLHVGQDAYMHLGTSLRYSTQNLPINTLIDSLLRPQGDVGDPSDTCVEWRLEAARAKPHLVLGSAPKPGGQWADNPVSSSWEIGALSYAEQLSLPGYSFAQHWKTTKGETMPDLVRPSRSDTSAYYAAYPAAVGISGVFRDSTRASGITRLHDGFLIASHNLRCKNLVLASGIFNEVIQPPPSLAPLKALALPVGPILVIGSGFTAADIIISAPPDRKIIHVFNWDPDNKPSPLRACHGSAYPEYAFVYRQMKLAAVGSASSSAKPAGRKQLVTPKALKSLPNFSKRDWVNMYEGHANAFVSLEDVMDGTQESTDHVRVCLQHQDEEEPRVVQVGSFHFAAGRRGSLNYLDEYLLRELLPMAAESMPQSPKLYPWAESGRQSRLNAGLDVTMLPSTKAANGSGPPQHIITGHSLRDKINDESGEMKVEVAPNVFAIGSLTGDSLVRFAYGCCCLVAGKLFDQASETT